MAKRRSGSFKGRHFTFEVILWALRWYLAFPVSYRDLASMLSDRGVQVDHTTLFRWVQAYAPTLERRIRRHLRPCNGSWRVDETYIKIKGAWTYLHRAVDSLGQTIDFMLSARRNATAARRFFRKAPRQPHTANPRTITVDKNAAYPSAVKRLTRAGQLWRFSRLRQCKYLNNIVEQDHRRIKRLVRPGPQRVAPLPPTAVPTQPARPSQSKQIASFPPDRHSAGHPGSSLTKSLSKNCPVFSLQARTLT